MKALLGSMKKIWLVSVYNHIGLQCCDLGLSLSEPHKIYRLDVPRTELFVILRSSCFRSLVGGSMSIGFSFTHSGF